MSRGPAEPSPSLLALVWDRIKRGPRDAIRGFLGETVWQWNLRHLPPLQRAGVVAARILYLTGRAFASSRAQLQAMALTYTTMLALVPAFAIIVALFSVRGLQEARGRLEAFIFDFLAASPDTREILSSELTDLTHNIASQGGVAGAAFFIFLFLTVVALLNTLENTLNQVWGVQRSRGFISKFVTYWCIATLGPLFLGIALVQGSALETQLQEATAWGESYLQWEEEKAALDTPVEAADPAETFGFGGVAGAVVGELEAERQRSDEPVSLEFILTGTRRAPEGGGQLISFGLTVITFTLLFAFLPNTKVRLAPALIGAVTATLLWTLTKWGLATSSSTLVRYNAIYGSLAAIPITMFWLYLTWLIVILGAELTFAIQNISSQRKEELASETTELCKEIVALRLFAAIARAFEAGERPPGRAELAERLGAPNNLCSFLLFHLAEDGLLREIERETDERGYVPGRPLDHISLADVIDSLRERAGIAFDLAWGEDLPVLSEHLGRANAAFQSLAGRITFRDIVKGLATREQAGEALDPEVAAVSVVAARAIASASIRTASGLLRSVSEPEPPAPAAAPTTDAPPAGDDVARAARAAAGALLAVTREEPPRPPDDREAGAADPATGASAEGSGGPAVGA